MFTLVLTPEYTNWWKKTYHHADFIFLSTLNFNGVVQHEVHELVKPAQNSNDVPASIELDYRAPTHNFIFASIKILNVILQ